MLIGQLNALSLLSEQQEAAERERNGLLSISGAKTEY